MKTKKLPRLAFFSLALLLAPVAFAESPDFHPCKSVADLNKEVSDCRGNAKYREAAQGCVAKYESFQLAAKASALKELASLSSIRVDSVYNHEAPPLAKMEARLFSAKELLALVVEKGEKTTGQLDTYLNNIVYPEDWDAPAAVIGDATKFFDAHKCYSTARDELRAMAEQVKAGMRDMNQAIANAELRVGLFRDLKAGYHF